MISLVLRCKYVEIALITLLLAGCGTPVLPLTSTVPSVTVTPSITPTPAAISTSTRGPTITSRPTSTPLPPPAWVTDFAAPILADISNRPPDIEDTFERPSRAWTLVGGGCADWRLSYEAGEIFITDCYIQHSGLYFNDYAVEIEGRIVSGTEVEMGFDFRDRLCSFGMRWNRIVDAKCYKYKNGERLERYMDFGQLGSRAIETNRLLLIVKGSRFAFYVNDEPAGFYEDHDIFLGGMSIGGGGSSGHTIDGVVAFDYFKAWNITNLALP